MVAPLQKVFEMHIFGLKQHKTIIIYQCMERIPYICGLDHNSVKNNSHINKNTPVSCSFVG